MFATFVRYVITLAFSFPSLLEEEDFFVEDRNSPLPGSDSQKESFVSLEIDETNQINSFYSKVSEIFPEKSMTYTQPQPTIIFANSHTDKSVFEQRGSMIVMMESGLPPVCAPDDPSDEEKKIFLKDFPVIDFYFETIHSHISSNTGIFPVFGMKVFTIKLNDDFTASKKGDFPEISCFKKYRISSIDILKLAAFYPSIESSKLITDGVFKNHRLILKIEREYGSPIASKFSVFIDSSL